MSIKGNSNLAEYVRQNIIELTNKKINILNERNGYIYLHRSGELKEGRNNEKGQSSVFDFGGICRNKYTAVGELQRIIWMHETQEFNGDKRLKGYII